MQQKQTNKSLSPMNIVMGSAGILLGIIIGYVLGAAQPTPALAVSATTPDDRIHSTAAVVSEDELQAYRSILANDPKNVRANVELGNRLYDAGRYSESIQYYEAALAVEPRNVNVSTDLGTALYYAGRVDDALVQLDTSLRIDPSHAQTWFNIGIVKRDGKKDRQGARAAWEQLLKVAPNYPEAERVKQLLFQLGI